MTTTTHNASTQNASTQNKNVVAITATDTFAASPEAVWKILSDDFLNVSKWAGGVTSSKANPETPNGYNGSPHGGRVCDVEGLGLTDERIVEYNAAARTLTYSIAAKKIPFFVASMTSRWVVSAGADAAHATVSFTATATTKGIMARIGKIPLNKMLGNAAPGLLADLKKYAEANA